MKRASEMLLWIWKIVWSKTAQTEFNSIKRRLHNKLMNKKKFNKTTSLPIKIFVDSDDDDGDVGSGRGRDDGVNRNSLDLKVYHMFWQRVMHKIPLKQKHIMDRQPKWFLFNRHACTLRILIWLYNVRVLSAPSFHYEFISANERVIAANSYVCLLVCLVLDVLVNWVRKVNHMPVQLHH